MVENFIHIIYSKPISAYRIKLNFMKVNEILVHTHAFMRLTNTIRLVNFLKIYTIYCNIIMNFYSSILLQDRFLYSIKFFI